MTEGSHLDSDYCTYQTIPKVGVIDPINAVMINTLDQFVMFFFHPVQCWIFQGDFFFAKASEHEKTKTPSAKNRDSA